MDMDPQAEPQPRVSRRGFEIAQQLLLTRIHNNGCVALLLTTTTPVTEAFTLELGPVQHKRQLAVYDEYNGIVKEMAAQHDTYVVDLHSAFTDRSQTELSSLLDPDGVHLTPDGEHLVAASVLRALEEIGSQGSDTCQWG